MSAYSASYTPAETANGAAVFAPAQQALAVIDPALEAALAAFDDPDNFEKTIAIVEGTSGGLSKRLTSDLQTCSAATGRVICVKKGGIAKKSGKQMPDELQVQISDINRHPETTKDGPDGSVLFVPVIMVPRKNWRNKGKGNEKKNLPYPISESGVDAWIPSDNIHEEMRGMCEPVPADLPDEKKPPFKDGLFMRNAPAAMVVPPRALSVGSMLTVRVANANARPGQMVGLNGLRLDVSHGRPGMAATVCCPDPDFDGVVDWVPAVRSMNFCDLDIPTHDEIVARKDALFADTDAYDGSSFGAFPVSDRALWAIKGLPGLYAPANGDAFAKAQSGLFRTAESVTRLAAGKAGKTGFQARKRCHSKKGYSTFGVTVISNKTGERPVPTALTVTIQVAAAFDVFRTDNPLFSQAMLESVPFIVVPKLKYRSSFAEPGQPASLDTITYDKGTVIADFATFVTSMKNGVPLSPEYTRNLVYKRKTDEDMRKPTPLTKEERDYLESINRVPEVRDYEAEAKAALKSWGNGSLVAVNTGVTKGTFERLHKAGAVFVLVTANALTPNDREILAAALGGAGGDAPFREAGEQISRMLDADECPLDVTTSVTHSIFAVCIDGPDQKKAARVIVSGSAGRHDVLAIEAPPVPQPTGTTTATNPEPVSVSGVGSKRPREEEEGDLREQPSAKRDRKNEKKPKKPKK